MRTRHIITALIVAGCLALCASQAQAADDARLTELERKVDALANRISEASGAAMVPDWVYNFKLKGDLRYRHEWIDMEDSADRNRHRIRARLGITGKVNDDVDVGLQFASGSDDPVSTNQTLDTSFTSKGLYLDLAYFDWHPAAAEGFHLMGGKVKNPFAEPVGNSDLIWDGDLRPEGMAASYEADLSEDVSVALCGGGFYAEERSSGADTSLWGGQLALTLNVPDMEKTYVKIGGSYFDYGNIECRGPLVGGAAGNTTTASGYAEDFDLIEGFAEIGMPVGDVPFRVFGDLVDNTAASNDSTGWLVGAGIGKCKKPGSWELVYNYRRLEKDCVVGAFTDSDFGGGGTDGEGHKIGAGYQLAKNWKLGATLFVNEVPLSNSSDYRRLQVDLQFKF